MAGHVEEFTLPCPLSLRTRLSAASFRQLRRFSAILLVFLSLWRLLHLLTALLRSFRLFLVLPLLNLYSTGGQWLFLRLLPDLLGTLLVRRQLRGHSQYLLVRPFLRLLFEQQSIVLV